MSTVSGTMHNSDLETRSRRKRALVRWLQQTEITSSSEGTSGRKIVYFDNTLPTEWLILHHGTALEISLVQPCGVY